jgi:hypothetical protein
VCLRWFARAGHLDPADAGDMAGWAHGGGFSLDASVRIEGQDRPGLERLLRSCARPAFALERLEQLGHDPPAALVTCARCALFGANTPWKRVRLTRGLGTSALSLAMKSRGSKSTCVVPSE